MKFMFTISSSCLVIIFFFFLFLFQCSNGSKSQNIISQSCKEASENDKNLSYDFCVKSLESNSSKNQPPKTLEDLVAMSILLTKSNATSIICNINNLLKNQELDDYVKACLHDCSDLYKDSISSLEDAAFAFKSKDLDTACIKLSSALDDSVTCEDQFKDKKGVDSPLAKENQVYFQLNVISLAFTQMCRQHF